MIEPSEIIFVGVQKSAVLWYRCALPAEIIGADWVGVSGSPGQFRVNTGMVRGRTSLPRWEDYKVIVLQQPRGREWLNLILRLQAEGRKVLFEVDDYIHGVRKVRGHHFGKNYTKKILKEIEMCMKVCDGIVVSTPYLGQRYRSFNKRVYVCENGLDCERYNLTKPDRPTTNIGWAGATGHDSAVLEWLNGAVIPAMREHDETCFVSVGNPGYSDPMRKLFGDERAIGTPFTMIESYPAAMMLMDIAIAPAGKNAWYRAKSDLRWLEAGALGIPIIADPGVYPHIEHGVTGFHAETPEEARDFINALVDDPELRRRVGERTRRHVRETRDISIVGPKWLEVCRAVAGGYESMAMVARS